MARKEIAFQFVAIGAASVSNAIQKIGKVSTITAVATLKLGRSAKIAVSGFGNLGKSLSSAVVGLNQGLQLFNRIAGAARNLTVGLIDAGGAVADTSAAFATLSTRGINTREVLVQLRSATQGQVADTELMRIGLAGLGGETNITVKNLSKLVNAIFLTSKGLGQDFRPSLEALRRSLATNTLTTLGAVQGFESVVTIMDKARETAQKTGEQVSKLSLFQIGLAEALRASGRRQAEFGDILDSSGDLLQKFRVDIKNAFDAVAESVVISDDLKLALRELSAVFSVFAGKSGDDARSLGKSIASIGAGTIQFGLDATEAFLAFSIGVNQGLQAAVRFADVARRGFKSFSADIQDVISFTTSGLQAFTLAGSDAENALGDLTEGFTEASRRSREAAMADSEFLEGLRRDAEENARVTENALDRLRRRREEVRAEVRAEEQAAQREVILRVTRDKRADDRLVDEIKGVVDSVRGGEAQLELEAIRAAEAAVVGGP